MAERVTVYFDFICPYAWRAAELFEVIAKPLDLEVDWQHFSLFQNEFQLRKQQTSPEWQLWNERIEGNDGSGCKGLLPFLASLAARKQGPELSAAFRLALQRANHQEYRPFTPEVVNEVAQQVGLDMERFEYELSNPEARTVLAQEHMRAVALNIFGTPTVVFPGGQLSYLRLQELPTSEGEAVALFSDVRAVLERYPYLHTLRRPRAKGN